MGLTLCVEEYLGWSIVTLDVQPKPAMPYQETQHTHHQMSIQDFAKEEMQMFFAQQLEKVDACTLWNWLHHFFSQPYPSHGRFTEQWGLKGDPHWPTNVAANQMVGACCDHMRMVLVHAPHATTSIENPQTSAWWGYLDECERGILGGLRMTIVNYCKYGSYFFKPTGWAHRIPTWDPLHSRCLCTSEHPCLLGVDRHTMIANGDRGAHLAAPYPPPLVSEIVASIHQHHTRIWISSWIDNVRALYYV